MNRAIIGLQKHESQFAPAFESCIAIYEFQGTNCDQICENSRFGFVYLVLIRNRIGFTFRAYGIQSSELIGFIKVLTSSLIRHENVQAFV